MIKGITIFDANRRGRDNIATYGPTKGCHDMVAVSCCVGEEELKIYEGWRKKKEVLGNLGLYRIAIDHLDESDALVVVLRDRYLAEHFILVGNNHANSIARYIRFPRGEFLQCNTSCSRSSVSHRSSMLMSPL